MAATSTNIKSPVGQLPGVGPVTQRALQRLGILTIEDVLTQLPYRLEDRSTVCSVGQLQANQPVVINVAINRIGARRSARGVLMIEAVAHDPTGKIHLLWFNQRYLLNFLRPNQSYFFYGEKKIIPKLNNPFIVKAIIQRPEITPFYRCVSGLTQRTWKKLFKLTAPYQKEVGTLLPASIIPALKNKGELLGEVHSDPSDAITHKARELLALEEMTLVGLMALSNAQKNKKSAEGLRPDINFLKKLVGILPFSLTDGQRRVTWDILKSLESAELLRHLLYGEVGSGKTVVAQLVAASVVRGGAQVAILCPTTTLAEQQYQGCQQLFEPQGISVALMTGAKKEEAYADSDIIIGTHALLQNSIRLPRLGLVIVDEQHRFGVSQREWLLSRNNGVHLLMMTATPIPRSLAQTLFSGLSISYLHDKPAHQQPVETLVFGKKEREKIIQQIQTRLSRGEPGYVICPVISEVTNDAKTLFSEERRSIESESKSLHQLFPAYKIGVLHGRLKDDEKNKILAQFKNGRIQILLSTTVVEVGIDNPDATWILIEEADRFGLAQLHQLRGRVGRGKKASVCFLSDTGTSEFGQKRLEALCQSTNGLELAEQDLSLRGPGELIGYEQSGLPNLRFASWQNIAATKKAFAIAQKIIDDGLEKYPSLERVVNEKIKDSAFG